MTVQKRFTKRSMLKFPFKLKPKECKKNIHTLCILQIDSSVVESDKISTIICPFVQKVINMLVVLPFSRSARCHQ